MPGSTWFSNFKRTRPDSIPYLLKYVHAPYISPLRCSIAQVAWPLPFSHSGIPPFRYFSHCAPAPLDRSTFPRANVEANDQLTASPGLSLPRAVRQPQPRSHPLYHVTSPSGRFLSRPVYCLLPPLCLAIAFALQLPPATYYRF